MFHALNKEHIRQIVNLELNKVAERLQDHNITLQASDAALDQLAQDGYDPEMGARPLRRVIQQKVEDVLSDKVLEHDFVDGDTVWVDVNKKKEIVLKRKVQKKEEPEKAAEPA